MPERTVSFLHVSDLHLLGDARRRQHGVDTAANLRQAIPMMRARCPDFIVATGDLTSDGSEASYRRLQSLLEPLPVPVYFVMGNDDDRAAFRRVFRPDERPSPDPVYAAFEQGETRFLLLDSALPGKVEGYLAAEQLRWLERELSAHPDRPAWVFLHHPPLPIYLRWLDALGLTNREEFLAVLARYPQVALVCYGHVHQARCFRYEGVLFQSVPSLAFQFSPISQEREITPASPGFRRIEVRGGKRYSWLHFLDDRIVPEPPLSAIPVYVR
jgi:Icc protein